MIGPFAPKSNKIPSAHSFASSVAGPSVASHLFSYSSLNSSTLSLRCAPYMESSPVNDETSSLATSSRSVGDDQSKVRSQASIFALKYRFQSSETLMLESSGRPEWSSPIPPTAAVARRNLKFGNTCASMDCTVM